MPTYRFPVLLWQDAGHTRHALLADRPGVAGVGSSDRDALTDLRDYLEWAFESEQPVALPDFEDAELEFHKVEVRPEYATPTRAWPCESTIILKVACVFGVLENGMPIASLPMLDVYFTYYDTNDRKSLVKRYVQQKLENSTPAEVARFLPPDSLRLESLAVHVSEKERPLEPAKPPAILVEVSEPLGDRATRRQFTRAIQREEEIAALVRRLRQEKSSILLVGESGVGKTAMLIDAVAVLEREYIEEAGKSAARTIPARRYWLTSAGRLIAGMKYLGQWEERCEEVIEALAGIQGVLCVDRLTDLIRTGGRGPTDSVAAFLMPYLQRGDVRIIAEVTPGELDAAQRLMPGLADLFQTVRIAPLGRTQSLTVLDTLVKQMRQNHKLEPEPGLTDLLLHLWKRFLPAQAFPGRVVMFLRELLEQSVRKKRTVLSHGDLITFFQHRTGLPEKFLRDEIVLRQAEVEAHFRERVIHQDEAARAATDLVLTFKAGLNDPNRPLGVYLFCGPTGVGKTEMAKALAEYFFGDRQDERTGKQTSDSMIRLDMSEYSGFDAATRLLGHPLGEPGELVRRIRQQPFTLVLLDEVEKANPEVFDILLGVFDEGRLTDTLGRLTSFRSSIIVMTSNLGADKQSSFGIGGTPESRQPRYTDEVRKFFRPEFFNRLDGVVTFQPLGSETIEKITRRELDAIGRRDGLELATLKLQWTPGLIASMAKVGFDPKYGARPLQRTLESRVVAPLARWLIDHPGLHHATIEGDIAGDEVTFRVA